MLALVEIFILFFFRLNNPSPPAMNSALFHSVYQFSFMFLLAFFSTRTLQEYLIAKLIDVRQWNFRQKIIFVITPSVVKKKKIKTTTSGVFFSFCAFFPLRGNEGKNGLLFFLLVVSPILRWPLSPRRKGTRQQTAGHPFFVAVSVSFLSFFFLSSLFFSFSVSSVVFQSLLC